MKATRRRLAGTCAGHAAELDRKVAWRAGAFCGVRRGDRSPEVFTTRIDTIYGVAAVLLSASHPQLEEMLAGVPGHTAMEAQLHAMRQKSTKAADIATAEKVGFFTGRFALNPFSGEHVPSG